MSENEKKFYVGFGCGAWDGVLDESEQTVVYVRSAGRPMILEGYTRDQLNLAYKHGFEKHERFLARDGSGDYHLVDPEDVER